MSGFAAPALAAVRVGFIGLGDRGSGAVQRLSYIEGVEIKALGDLRIAAIEGSQKYLARIGRSAAQEFSGDDIIWKKLVELPDLDLIYICTPWVWHTQWQFMPWKTESMLSRRPYPELSMKHGSLLRPQRERRSIA
jgi:hypothetical protein